MISCNQYDYIEIACMYQYPIILTMKTGVIFECTALDTKYNDKREECIKVDAEGSESLVLLDEISTLEVAVENPHFKVVSFTLGGKLE